jgi:Protein of unknown function (DUF3800)
MHILFVDESGTPPNPSSHKSKYFVIAGTIIPEQVWHRIRDALLGLKARRKIRGEFKWRYFSPDNDDVRNPMRKCSQEERNDIRTEICKIICSEKSIKCLACVACIESAYAFSSVDNRDDLYAGTYKPVSERFQYYLQDLSRIVGRDEFGIIVADHRGINDDQRFRGHHEKLLHSSSEFTSNYKNLIESLFVHPSDLSVGIQLADLVAGAVWRKFEKNDDRWFQLLEPAFRCSTSGKVEGYGLVKYPKTGWA